MIFSVLVTLCGNNMSVSSDFGARSGESHAFDYKLVLETMLAGRIFDPKFIERESTKSSVDDLIRGRGGVSFRAAFTLRVTEPQPHLTWRFEHDLNAHFSHSYSILMKMLLVQPASLHYISCPVLKFIYL